MGVKRIIAAGMLAAAATFASYSSSYAQAQSEKIDTTQNAEAKKIVEKILKNVFLNKLPFTIGGARFDKAKNKISVFDLRFTMAQMSFVYDRMDIVNYTENEDTGAYSIDKLIAKDATFTFSKEYLKVLEESFKKANKKSQTPPPPFLNGPMKISSFTYAGVTGSTKENFVAVEFGSMNGFDMGPAAPLDFSKFKAEFKNYRVNNVDKMQGFAEEMMALATADPKAEPAQEDIAKMMSSAFKLYSYFSFESMDMSGFPEIINPVTGDKVSFSKMTAKNLKNGVLEHIGIEGFSMDPANKTVLQSMKFDEFAIKGFNYTKLGELTALMTQNPAPDPMLVAQWVQVLGGLSIKGLDVKTKTQIVSGSSSMSWGKFVGLFPTDIQWKGHSIVSAPEGAAPIAKEQGPVAPPQDLITILKSVGLDKLDLKYDARLSWDAKTQTVTLSPFVYDADKLFVLDFSASIGNITEVLLKEQDPQKMLIHAFGSTVGPIKLELTDKGIQKIYELQAKGMWEGVSAPFAQDPRLKPVVDNMTKLVNSPNGKFTIILKPKGTVSTSQLSGAMAIDPFSALALFDIETSYVKN